MTEPLQTAVLAVLPGAVSATTLAYLGVDYFALLGASAGIGFMAVRSSRVLPTPRLMLQGLLQAYLGALFGTMVHWALGATPVHAVLIALSVIGGAGAKKILDSAIDLVLRRINKDTPAALPKEGAQ
jgi:hypothetical protein